MLPKILSDMNITLPMEIWYIIRDYTQNIEGYLPLSLACRSLYHNFVKPNNLVPVTVDKITSLTYLRIYSNANCGITVNMIEVINSLNVECIKFCLQTGMNIRLPNNIKLNETLGYVYSYTLYKAEIKILALKHSNMKILKWLHFRGDTFTEDDYQYATQSINIDSFNFLRRMEIPYPKSIDHTIVRMKDSQFRKVLKQLIKNNVSVDNFVYPLLCCGHKLSLSYIMSVVHFDNINISAENLGYGKSIDYDCFRILLRYCSYISIDDNYKMYIDFNPKLKKLYDRYR